MERAALPGLAFSMPTDAGFVVGLATHDIARLGTLVWIAEGTFDEEPGRVEAEAVSGWRWPVFFPLNAALGRRIVTKIGHVAIPDPLKPMPVMRSRAGYGPGAGWNLVERAKDGATVTRSAGRATDPKLPLYQVVNDTRLKEMIVSDWRPETVW